MTAQTEAGGAPPGELAGRILTVQGPIAPEELGICLVHEHLIVDQTSMWQVPSYSLIVDDEELVIDEVAAFRRAGGAAIVDVTNVGLGRDPRALARIARASGLHLVMGAGWYRERAYPSYVQERSADDLAEMIVRDVLEGVDGSGVRAGIIGEIGTERKFISPAQERVFRAAARAHRRTGAPITTHTTHWGELALEQLDLLAEEGVDPRRVIVGHLGDRRDPHFYLPIAERGCFLGIDNVGCVEFQREEQRARTVLALIRAGHLSQLLLSHDICTLADLKWYGGKGFDYVLVVFVPLLRSLGVTDEEIHALLVDNPRRALAFSAPSAAARPAGDR